MKKFRFRLEKVLKHRNSIREDKKRILMLCNSRVGEAERRLNELEHIARSVTIAGGAVMSAEQLLLIGSYSLRLKDEIVSQRLTIVRLQDEAAQALNDYIEASKEARALELLRERKRQAYGEFVAKEEEKFLDELTTQRMGLREG